MSQATDTKPRSGMLRVLLLAMAAVAGLIAFLSYSWFIDPSTEPVETLGTADAVVVFVGSEERIDTAVQLMERGVAPSLVIPNGRSADMDDDLCDDAPFQVYCPETETVDTTGEARTIGRLAEEQGWSRLVAVTSGYHVHRATYQLLQCHDGEVQAVESNRSLDRDDWVETIVHEWAGTLAAMTIQRAC